ncbi:MAG: patatin-like phospholipase family protein [Acidimicrobiales bacterium]
MAGGGTKVAFQAGVLQVWLDEAGLEFDHADGASGGVFNLAMWCQGMTGTQIADNWRNNRPLRGVDPNLGQWLRGPHAESLFRLGRFRRNVLTEWGIDWDRIRSTARQATFNLYNFSRHRHEVLTPDQMDEDRLISAVSLPMWFQPVPIDGDTYIDAVFVSDANLEESIRRGGDELWVIWTVSQRGEWYDGFAANYFQMIEAMANGQLRAMVKRIDESNRRIEKGEHSEFDRPITVKMLRAEVPLHYLMNFTRDRMAAAVELGVKAGRQWCTEEGIPLRPAAPAAPLPGARREPPSTVSFTEEMAGHLGLGHTDFEHGEREGRQQGTALMFRLTITADDLPRFIVEPAHEAVAVGWVVCEALGGRLPVERGVFNLFVDQADPSDKRMLYQLWFRDGSGRPLTLAGHKVVRDHAGLDMWRDTTTLFTHIVDGHVTLAEAAQLGPAALVGAGIIRISPAAFARQLTTFRSTGADAAGRVTGLFRFTRLFMGDLWDVYGKAILSSSPF